MITMFTDSSLVRRKSKSVSSRFRDIGNSFSMYRVYQGFSIQFIYLGKSRKMVIFGSLVKKVEGNWDYWLKPETNQVKLVQNPIQGKVA